MALVVSTEDLQDEVTRTVSVDVKEPGPGDKIIPHKLDITVEVMDREDWGKLTAKWARLSHLAAKMEREKDFVMDDDDAAEARKPIHEYAEPYIKEIGPITDESGNVIAFSEVVKAALMKKPWIQPGIQDAFLAVQKGITVAEQKKTRAKN